LCECSCVNLRRYECHLELGELRIRLKTVDSQQKVLMSNIDDDIYQAVKDVYDKVLLQLLKLLLLCYDDIVRNCQCNFCIIVLVLH